MKIANNTIVSLRFTMKTEQGEILADTMGGTPVDYLQGSGTIMPALEKEVEGMECCRNKSFSLDLDGKKFFMDVRIDNVRAATEEEIRLGKAVIKTDCGPDCKC